MHLLTTPGAVTGQWCKHPADVQVGLGSIPISEPLGFYSWKHFWKEGRKCLLNDALNTYWKQYGIKHGRGLLSKRGNPLLPLAGLLFLISSKSSFICTIPQDYTYHNLCYTSRGTLAGTRIVQWVHHERSIRWPWLDALPQLHLAPIKHFWCQCNC